MNYLKRSKKVENCDIKSTLIHKTLPPKRNKRNNTAKKHYNNLNKCRPSLWTAAKYINQCNVRQQKQKLIAVNKSYASAIKYEKKLS